ncbi:hypothetical protein AB0N89_21705 [Amycolatopsis sp. NPDC089917]
MLCRFFSVLPLGGAVAVGGSQEATGVAAPIVDLGAVRWPAIG